MWSSSKLVRATIKMSLPNEVWMNAKHKLNGVLQYDERMVTRKGIFHVSDCSLVPLINCAHAEMLGVRIKHVEAMSDLLFR